MISREIDYEKWISSQEYVKGKLYKKNTIIAYINQLNYGISQAFEIPGITSIFNILDPDFLHEIELKYMSGVLSKKQKDYRSAYHSYINFCKSNEENFTINPSINDNPDFVSRTEGGKKIIISVRIERDQRLRRDAVKIHGLECQACGFNFKDKYGELGEGYIEVHHLKILSKIAENNLVITDPKTDLSVVCSNCHRMIHRKKGTTLTIDELKQKLKNIS